MVEEPLAAPSKIAAASIVPSLEGASYTIYYFKDEGSTEEIEAAAHVGDPEDESIRSFAIRGYDGLSREGYECVGWTNADETLLVTAGQAYVFEASAEDAVLYLWPVWRENSADASSAPTMESDFTGQGVTDNDALAEDGGQTGQVQGETSSDESITAGTLEEIDDEWPPTAAGPDSAGSDAGGTLSIGVISVGFVAMFLLGLLAKLAH